ncbi:MAG TPA: energy transducer TonB [Bryobacteraceae bacterium]|jgi:protein TonB|nr:energy transducer TonB [Bryobacteraceae bacterium]
MTACLEISDFQGYLENPGDARLESHLAVCTKCRKAFDRAATTDRRVNIWLEALASRADEMPLDLNAALARVTLPQPVDHLANLLAPDRVDIPWYVSLYQNLREIFRPQELPPLNVTSRPIPVTEIWGQYAKNPRSRYAAIAIHAAVFALLMVGATNKTVRQTIQDHFEVIDPTIRPYVPDKSAGGGGGGARQPLPVTAGQAPKPAPRQFVPPQIVDHEPILAMNPSIFAPPDTVLPQNNLPNWGDPLAKLSGLSNGPGLGGGMGNGANGGLGSGKGPGYGQSENGGFAGGIFNAGGGVTAPVLVLQVDPEYSDDARKAKYSGSVTLAIIVDTDGRPRDIRVTRSLGMGLDEKAIESVQKWRFKPGLRSGQPVNVRATVVVNFRLL